MSEEERKLLEQNIIYEDTIVEQDKEIERLNKGAEALIFMSNKTKKERDDYKERIDKALKLLNDWEYLDRLDCYRQPKEVIDILKGEDKE